MSLAVELFAEGDWAACRREALRVSMAVPSNETAALLGSVSALRLGRGGEGMLTVLDELSTNGAVRVRAMAAYELGRAEWRAGSFQQAFKHLSQSFCEASDQELFLRAGCSLNQLINDNSQLAPENDAICTQLDSCRDLWSDALREECRLDRSQPDAWSGLPAKWIVAFYRLMLSPALGARCSLEPSCSEYFSQAARKHGWLAVPIQADRFIREPSVVVEKRHPIFINGQIRYADPLSDHDWWFQPEQEPDRHYGAPAGSQRGSVRISD